ncbi:hypothetical protein DFH11DRAFT_1850696 [Phellopilus nigrolimitatus]|nr:hypothetical protein DFH11DRAFT_1850696 [Phellopilus nigrolimitatus]
MASQTSFKITLYDVPTALEEKTMTYTTRRIRLVLDFKRIPFETAWIDFPDVEATCKSVGAPPTSIKADGNPRYTVPFITVSSPTTTTIALSDSYKIAAFIEDTFPDPEHPLLPENSRVADVVFRKYLNDKVLVPTFQILFPPFIRALPEHTQDWFIKTRLNLFGKPLSEILPKGDEAIAEAWKNIEKAFDELASYLDANGKGNCRVTSRVSFIEMELVAFLYMTKRIDYSGVWKMLEGRNEGRWVKLLDVYAEYLPVHYSIRHLL